MHRVQDLTPDYKIQFRSGATCCAHTHQFISVRKIEEYYIRD